MRKKLSIILIIFLLWISLYSKVDALTIVLDPGHGGVDPGASSDDGSTNEKDITLKIAKYLRDYLNQYVNTNVLLTHEGNINGEYSIFDRAIFARNHNADLLVSLHINSYDNSPARGAEIYVTENKSLPKYYEQTSRLANNILNKLGELNIGNRGVRTKLIERDTTDVYSDGTRADYYGIIRYAMRGCHIDDGRIWGGSPANVQNGEGVPTILIEHCFIKGSDFADFLNTDEKIRNIAIADGKGIVENYGLKTEAELEENRVDSVSLDISSYNMKIDDTITLNAKVMPEASKFKEVIWTSSDTNVATVSQDGVVSGVGVGTATITVTTTKENRTASMVVTVEEKPLDEKYSIDFSGINESNGMLTNIELNTTVGQLKQKIIKSDNLYIEVIDKNGNLLNDNKNVATSIKVLLKDIETSRLVRTYTVVIYGDTDGDGMLSSKDALAIIKNKVGKIEFENEYFLEAGRVCIETRNVKSVPSSRDALNIIKCKIGETEIDQSI